MRIAVLSDIHGNYWALSRVLKDIESKKPDLILNLGDSLYGPLKPQLTFDLLKSYDIKSISGNQDRNITENFSRPTDNKTLQYVVNDLNNEAIEWLSSLPKTKIISSVFMCHGTPDSDTTYLLEELYPTHKTLRGVNRIEELLKGVNEGIVLCGHSHTHRIVQTSKRYVINPGSVGLSAYDESHPTYHKVESFNSMTQYSIIDIINSEINVEQVSLNYDYEKAAICASQNNRADWAKWLRTGMV